MVIGPVFWAHKTGPITTFFSRTFFYMNHTATKISPQSKSKPTKLGVGNLRTQELMIQQVWSRLVLSVVVLIRDVSGGEGVI